MSTTQRSHACLVAVDPSLGDILRLQTLAVLEVNHHYFEDVRDFGAPAQRALAAIYRDAFAVLDALGWAPPANPTTTHVPLTAGLIEQLRRRRYDLGHTNIDRLHDFDEQVATRGLAAIRQAIEPDRLAAQALDRLFAAYHQAARRGVDQSHEGL